MVDQFHDFDAAWAEEDDEPVVIKLLGREWQCKRPSEVPASLLLKMDRLLLAVTTGDIPDDLVIDEDLSQEGVLRSFAGDENVDAWLSEGLSMTRLSAVSRRLNAVYRGQDPDAVGGAQAANRATRRAAKKKTRSQ